MTEKMSVAEFMFCLNLARKFVPQMQAEWEEECAEYARQGYRPHYCIHGTNQWTDYDNICGGCEDGVTLRQIACERAWGIVKNTRDRMAFAREATRLGAPVDVNGPDGLWAWAMEGFRYLA